MKWSEKGHQQRFERELEKIDLKSGENLVGNLLEAILLCERYGLGYNQAIGALLRCMDPTIQHDIREDLARKTIFVCKEMIGVDNLKLRPLLASYTNNRFLVGEKASTRAKGGIQWENAELLSHTSPPAVLDSGSLFDRDPPYIQPKEKLAQGKQRQDSFLDTSLNLFTHDRFNDPGDANAVAPDKYSGGEQVFPTPAEQRWKQFLRAVFKHHNTSDVTQDVKSRIGAASRGSEGLTQLIAQAVKEVRKIPLAVFVDRALEVDVKDDEKWVCESVPTTVRSTVETAEQIAFEHIKTLMTHQEKTELVSFNRTAKAFAGNSKKITTLQSLKLWALDRQTDSTLINRGSTQGAAPTVNHISEQKEESTRVERLVQEMGDRIVAALGKRNREEKQQTEEKEQGEGRRQRQRRADMPPLDQRRCFRGGNCSRRDCPFAHDERRVAPCPRGRECRFSTERCWYRHEGNGRGEQRQQRRQERRDGNREGRRNGGRNRAQ